MPTLLEILNATRRVPHPLESELLHPTEPDHVPEHAQEPAPLETGALGHLAAVPGAVAGHALDALGYVGDTLDSLGGKQIRRALVGENPIGDAHVSGRDILERWGIAPKNKPGLFNDIPDFLGDVGGFATEIATDPTSYIGLGGLTRAGKAAKMTGSVARADARIANNVMRSARTDALARIANTGDIAGAVKAAQAHEVRAAAANVAQQAADAATLATTWGDRIRKGQSGLAHIGLPDLPWPLPSVVPEHLQNYKQFGAGNETAAKIADALGAPYRLAAGTGVGRQLGAWFNKANRDATTEAGQKVAQHVSAAEEEGLTAAAQDAMRRAETHDSLDATLRAGKSQPPAPGAAAAGAPLEPAPLPKVGPELNLASTLPRSPKQVLAGPFAINSGSMTGFQIKTALKNAGIEAGLDDLINGQKYSHQEIIDRLSGPSPIAQATEAAPHVDDWLKLPASRTPDTEHLGHIIDDFGDKVDISPPKASASNSQLENIYADWQKQVKQKKTSKPFPEFYAAQTTRGMGFLHHGDDAVTRMAQAKREAADTASSWMASKSPREAAPLPAVFNGPSNLNAALESAKAKAASGDAAGAASDLKAALLSAKPQVERLASQLQTTHSANKIIKAMNDAYDAGETLWVPEAKIAKDAGLSPADFKAGLKKLVDDGKFRAWGGNIELEDTLPHAHIREQFPAAEKRIASGADYPDFSPYKVSGPEMNLSQGEPIRESAVLAKAAVPHFATTGIPQFATPPLATTGHGHGNMWDEIAKDRAELGAGIGDNHEFNQVINAHGPKADEAMARFRSDIEQRFGDLPGGDAFRGMKGYKQDLIDSFKGAERVFGPASGWDDAKRAEINNWLEEHGKTLLFPKDLTPVKRESAVSPLASDWTSRFGRNSRGPVKVNEFAETRAPGANPLWNGEGFAPLPHQTPELHGMRDPEAVADIINSEALHGPLNPPPPTWYQGAEKIGTKGHGAAPLQMTDAERSLLKVPEEYKLPPAATDVAGKLAQATKTAEFSKRLADQHEMPQNWINELIKTYGAGKEVEDQVAVASALAGTLAARRGISKSEMWGKMLENVKASQSANALQPVFDAATGKWKATGAPQRGAIKMAEGLPAKLISLYKAADSTTWLHEMWHATAPHLDYAEKAVMGKWLEGRGIKAFDDNGFWTVDGQEETAKAFEAFLHSGKASNPEMQGVFQRIAQSFRAVYEKLKQVVTGAPPEANKVFDALLSGGAAKRVDEPAKALGLGAPMKAAQTTAPADLAKMTNVDLLNHAKQNPGSEAASDAMGEFVSRNRDELARNLRGKIAGKNVHDLEDMMQEGFVKLLAGVNSFDAAKAGEKAKDPALAWAKTVIGRRALDEIKHSKVAGKAEGVAADAIRESADKELLAAGRAATGEAVDYVPDLAAQAEMAKASGSPAALAAAREEAAKVAAKTASRMESQREWIANAGLVPADAKKYEATAGAYEAAKKNLKDLDERIAKLADSSDPAIEAQHTAAVSLRDDYLKSYTETGKALGQMMIDLKTRYNKAGVAPAEKAIPITKGLGDRLRKQPKAEPAPLPAAVAESTPLPRQRQTHDVAPLTAAPEMPAKPPAKVEAAAANREPAPLPVSKPAAKPALEVREPKDVRHFEAISQRKSTNPAERQQTTLAKQAIEWAKGSAAAKEPRASVMNRALEEYQRLAKGEAPSVATKPPTTAEVRQQESLASSAAMAPAKVTPAPHGKPADVTVQPKVTEPEPVPHPQTVEPPKSEIPEPAKIEAPAEPTPAKSPDKSPEITGKVPDMESPKGGDPAEPPKEPMPAAAAEALPPSDTGRVLRKLVEEIPLNEADRVHMAANPDAVFKFADELKGANQNLLKAGQDLGVSTALKDVHAHFPRESIAAREHKIGKREAQSKKGLMPYLHSIILGGTKYTGQRLAKVSDWDNTARRDVLKGWKEGTVGLNDAVRKWAGLPESPEMLRDLDARLNTSKLAEDAVEKGKTFDHAAHLKEVADFMSKQDESLRGSKANFFDQDVVNDLFTQQQRMAKKIAGGGAIHKLFADMAEAGASGSGGMSIAEALKSAGIDVNKRVLGHFFESNAAELAKKGVKTIEDLDKLTVPNQYVAEAKRFLRSQDDPEYMKPFLRLWDGARDVFKKSVTVLWPANWARNGLSGQFANWVTGAISAKAMKEAADVIQGKDSKYLKEMELFSVLDARKGFRGYGANKIDDIREVGKGAKVTPRQLYDKNRAEATLPGPLGAWEAAGGTAAGMVEAWNRATHYIARKQQGWAPYEAAQSTLGTHFAYGNHTSFEKGLKRFAIPFYSFARFNLPWHLEQLALHPGGKLAQTIRGVNVAREDAPIPPYLAGKFVTPIGKSGDGESYRYLSGLGLPFEEAFERFDPNSARRTVESHLGMAHPLIKAPLELLSGRQFHTGLDLADLHSFPTGNQVADQAIFNSPIARGVTTVRTLADDRKGVGSKALNLLTGLRVTDVDLARAAESARREEVKDALLSSPNFREMKTIVPRKGIELSQEERQMLAELRRKKKKTAAKNDRGPTP